MSSPTLSPIYDRLHGTDAYHPFTANTFADWSSEAGDTVTITRGGEDYAAPIHKQTISWRGQQRITMETGGNKEREATERVSDRKFRSSKSSARTSSGKTHTFEVNDAHLLYEIDNPDTGVMTRLEVAEGDIVAEVTRATEAEGGIQQDISSLEITIDGITQTVGTIQADVTTLDGKVTTIEGSALWTQRDNITGVVGEFDVVEDSSTHVKTLVVKSGGGLSIRRDGVAFGVYDDGTLTAGVIATKVNGVASTNIYADKILMSSASGAPTVQVTVNGKLDATEFTAANINSLFSGAVGFNALSGDFTFLGADYLTVSEGTSAGTLSATSFSLANSDPFTNCIIGASVSGNTLTLTPASGSAITFSKATTLSDAWSSGTLTVTASPQGETLVRTLASGTPTWSGYIATVPINATWGSSGQYSESTGFNVTVNASTAYNAGWDYAITQRVVSAQAAGSSEIPIKILTYDEKWKINFTIPDSSGVNQVSSYVVQAPSGSTPTTVNVVTAGWQDVGGTRPNITFSPDSGSGSSKSVYLQIVYVPGTESCDFAINSSYDNSSFSEIKRIYTKLKQGSWSNNKLTVTMTNQGETHTYTTTEVNASGIYSNGWTAAYGKVSWPSSGTSSSMTVKAPAAYGSTPDQQSVSYTVSADNTYAYIKQGAVVVARVSHSAYANGYASAHLSGAWGTGSNSNVFTVTKVQSGSSDSLQCRVTSGISYNSSAHTYTATAYGNQSSKSITTSGTEAYEAGWYFAEQQYTNLGNPGQLYTKNGNTYTAWQYPMTLYHK